MGYHDNNQGYHAYHGCIPLPLVTAREATAGDPGDIAANGGLLASDSTPALSGAASTVSQQALWVSSNGDQILWDIPIPEDFDGRDDVLVELWVASGGTTNPATFTVATNWDGAAADVSDTATGLAQTAVHKTTARISAADVPDSPSFLSLALTPAAHTTDAMILKAARILYTPKNV